MTDATATSATCPTGLTSVWPGAPHAAPDALEVRRFRLEIIAGPGTGRVIEIGQPRVRLGRGAGNDVVLDDAKVSRVHAELAIEARGYRVRDLGSSNGVVVDGIQLVDGYVPAGAAITLGRTTLALRPLAQATPVALDDGRGFPLLVGSSLPMRRLFAAMRKVATTDATVLLTGETGTGKDLIALALHRASARGDGPFVIADCGAIAASLFEGELFGHEIGAFTGATTAAPGLFERAHGGTLFLDEIGELPPELQPKLLRAVQTREVRRLGGSRAIACDVRIIAATRRDLATEVNRGHFREDLYFRLAVVELIAPPLRERAGDLDLLIDHFAAELGGASAVVPTGARAAMHRHPWPGNVRELRNAVERALVLPDAPLGLAAAGGERLALEVDTRLPFRAAKQRLIDDFDRQVLERLLARHDGNISEAARATGLDRVSIYKIMRRLGMVRDRGREAG